MKILWITKHPIVPINTGSQIRTYYLIKNLSTHSDITVVCSRGPGITDDTCDPLAELPKVNIQYPLENLDSLSARLQLSFWKHYSSLREKYCWGEHPLSQAHSPLYMWHRFLVEWIGKHNPRVIILDHIWHAETLKYLKRRYPDVKFIINFHNVESINMYRYLEKEERGTRRARVFAKLHKKIQERESNLFRYADLYWTCSKHDLDVLSQLQRKKSISGFVVPNGIDTASYRFDQNSNKQSENALIFVGVLRYPLVVDALMWFFKYVWPIVKKERAGIRFKMVGLDPGKKLKELALSDKSIELVGTVDDVRPQYKDASVSVCPIQSGSGTRIKILEAMSVGVPVVATSIGAEGIESVDKKHLLLADNPTDFAKAIMNLLNDEKLYNSIQRNARKLVESQYDWSFISREASQSITASFQVPVVTCDASHREKV